MRDRVAIRLGKERQERDEAADYQCLQDAFYSGEQQHFCVPLFMFAHAFASAFDSYVVVMPFAFRYVGLPTAYG